MAQNASELSEYLDKLSECEEQMAKAEKECEIYHARKTQDIFLKRREILKNIPQFWYIVLAQSEDFAEWIRPEDLKYIETISDIYVHRDIVDSDDTQHYRNFSVTVEFLSAGQDGDTVSIPLQKVTKKFTFVKEDGLDKMVSEPVTVEWPAELESICPGKLRAQKKPGEFSPDERKRYRQGMRSFFAWFEWTGTKPGKEFRSGDDLAQLLLDEIFPSAVNLYVEAMNSEEDSDVDSSEGEELDVSDEEETKEPDQKKQKI